MPDQDDLDSALQDRILEESKARTEEMKSLLDAYGEEAVLARIDGLFQRAESGQDIIEAHVLLMTLGEVSDRPDIVSYSTERVMDQAVRDGRSGLAAFSMGIAAENRAEQGRHNEAVALFLECAAAFHRFEEDPSEFDQDRPVIEAMITKILNEQITVYCHTVAKNESAAQEAIAALEEKVGKLEYHQQEQAARGMLIMLYSGLDKTEEAVGHARALEEASLERSDIVAAANIAFAIVHISHASDSGTAQEACDRLRNYCEQLPNLGNAGALLEEAEQMLL